MIHVTHLVYACAAMVLLVFIVGCRMLFCRVQEMRKNKISPQRVATSQQMSAMLQNVQAADNFRNLFEVPVLLYVLCVMAISVGHTPTWLVMGAWLFVVLRYIHSAIHCTYNRVMHRFRVYGASFLLLVVLWMAFLITLPTTA